MKFSSITEAIKDIKKGKIDTRSNVWVSAQQTIDKMTIMEKLLG